MLQDEEVRSVVHRIRHQHEVTRIIHSDAVHNPETAGLLIIFALARVFLGQHIVNMFSSKNATPPRLFKSWAVFPRYSKNNAGVARWLFVFLLPVLLSATPARAQDLPFKPGESLLYSARWLFFDAGMVESSVYEAVEHNGRRHLRFNMHTWTTNVISKIFTMDDQFESIWDPETRLPASMKAVIRESSTTKDKLLEFDHSRRTARVTVNDKPPEMFSLNAEAQDFFSASFLVRATRLKPKQKLLVPVFEDNKNYHADIYVAKRERIPVLDGEADTIMLIARLKFEGAFTGSSLLYIWLTDDEYQIPVRLKISMAFGDIDINLVRAEGVPLRLIQIAKTNDRLAEKQ